MKRKLYENLLEWKQSPRRKPLILSGARQVGKTWLLQEFAKREFKNFAYVNCDQDEFAKTLFEDYDVARIVRLIEVNCNVRIIPGETMIILDELQEVPRGLGALKYFCEDAPQIHIAVAGSLLGIGLHQGTSFPVGKVDELTLRPLDFEEFLGACGEGQMAELLNACDWRIIDSMRSTYVERLRRYFMVGGMPEAVNTYLETNSNLEVRKVQKKILHAYGNDISKHAPQGEVVRINLVWNSIVAQLTRENRKFIYSALAEGARAKDFELAIQWLVDAGIVHRISRVNKAVLPLKFYEDFNAFKLYSADCGLLGAKAEAPMGRILAGNEGFQEYKGAFTENYVLQELKASLDTSVFYHSSGKSTVEIDFIFQLGSRIVPSEVKAAENLQSKSLKTFIAKNPGLKGLRFSLSPYRDQEWMENVPLYGVSAFIRKGLKQDG